MCAIAGILSLPASMAVVDAMQETMARRGPDGKGIYQNGGCSLLHSRLAVIDPERGKQPMILEWAGETYVIVYNGELYNTAALRRELEENGHRFVTHSDTEVVLHAYARFGGECVYHLNGIFAFAVWEQKRKRLFLARDRIGVKPLFYKIHEGGLLFASELKTILAYPTVRPELDREGIMQLLLLGPGRLPGSGVLRGIRELEPGCRGWYENGRLRTDRYWYLRDREHTDDFDTTAEKVRYLVTDAIKSQMVSDVPIGTFLSGGLDSSIITAICAKEKADQGERLHTFSVDYQDNDRNFQANKFQPEADRDYIQIMVQSLDTAHHATELTTETLMDALDQAVMARDLPGMADVDGSLLAFSGEIRRNVKVALSGECADEIFGGYPWYRDPEVRTRDGFPWAQNTAQRVELLHPVYRSLSESEDFVREAYESTCRESDILPGCSPEERRMKEMMNLNFRWFMQTLLDRKDRMSMYHSLEVRVPFCDYRIAEYLYGVPWEYKDYRGKEKGLLRHAMEGLLPKAVLWRKKSPYPKTFDPAYTRAVEESLAALLSQKDAPIFGVLDRQAVGDLFSQKLNWPWYGQLMGKPQTMAYLLQIDFWLRHYHVQVV